MKSRKIVIVSILCLQTVLITLFSIFVKYDEASASSENPMDDSLDSKYPYFQDVHVMIFVGFGFLMTFLRKYGYTALGFTFFISALVMQWGLLCHGFFHMSDGHIRVSILNLINADVVAAAVLISYGAVLGKVSSIQLIVMAAIETVCYSVNEYVGEKVFQATDAGGSMYVHLFGAYFGLAVSFTLGKCDANDLESPTYQSDINAMIGSLFLWMFWPSFNAALLDGDEKHRAIVNTYLALTASCLTAFATSSIVNKSRKFNMVHVQNATLAGGVCIGTVVNLMIQPYGALLIGSFAGILATLGFRFLQKAILLNLRIHDTCGVNNLHGLPGIAAGIIGAVMTGIADNSTYGERLTDTFPALGPPFNRTAIHQSGYQLLALLISFIIAVAGGLVTGLFIRNFKNNEKLFDDGVAWDLPEEEEKTETKRNGDSTAIQPF